MEGMTGGLMRDAIDLRDSMRRVRGMACAGCAVWRVPGSQAALLPSQRERVAGKPAG